MGSYEHNNNNILTRYKRDKPSSILAEGTHGEAVGLLTVGVCGGWGVGATARVRGRWVWYDPFSVRVFAILLRCVPPVTSIACSAVPPLLLLLSVVPSVFFRCVASKISCVSTRPFPCVRARFWFSCLVPPLACLRLRFAFAFPEVTFPGFSSSCPSRPAPSTCCSAVRNSGCYLLLSTPTRTYHLRTTTCSLPSWRVYT